MWKQIFKTTLVAGILDITAACLQAWLTQKIAPAVILKYLASGAFGKSAFEGGSGMIAMGLLFHFIIVFACTVIFFFLYARLTWLHHSIVINSFLIAFVAWVVTNLIIIPLSRIPIRPFHFSNALIAYGILVICIGLPISFFAKKYFTFLKKKELGS